MARWHSCNILQVGAARRVWQFDARKTDCPLNREQAVTAGQPLPENLVAKSWTTLWQPKLNVAWLAAEHVFLRVVHLPQADLAETRAMVEFQLEKLSPIPVTQMVWSIHVLPAATAAKSAAPIEGEKPKEALQTIIVVMVARNLVEEFLGKLEQDGFLADRLEVPLIDQLQHTAANGDGAWIYLDDEKTSALVAWWFGGALQSLGFINLPADKNATDLLREQLTQMTWAGELEGWLQGTPWLHLVADDATAAEWEPVLRQAMDQAVEVVPALEPRTLAATTAKRAAHASPKASLLPAEFAARYQQQFVDRLWMRGLGAMLALYAIVVVVWFAAVQVQVFRARAVEGDIAGLAPKYTNALQIKARYQVLKDRQDLKFAALECWKATADLLPEGVTLQQMDFREGKKLVLNGTAPAGQDKEILDFNEKLRKVQLEGQSLFTKFEQLNYRKDPGNVNLSWNFSCELNRKEAP